ncbi:MAG: RNA 3'-terminal phosphate cyclase, partial [Halobacteria archaeon]|nr:RNA 3'-terminal phosphate cyclase [Halobacteria archaeon]
RALGEKGKPAEDVGEEAARELLDGVESEGTVDVHTADQLVPYVALAGGEYLAPERTSHLDTNAWVCEKLLGTDIRFEASEGRGVWVHADESD